MATVGIAGLAQLTGSKHTVNATLAEITADLALGNPDSQLLAHASKFKTLNITDTGVAEAAQLLSIDGQITAQLKIAGITSISGDAQQVATLYAAQKAKAITGLGNETVSLVGGTIEAAYLVAVDKATSGTVTVTGHATLEGSLKDVGAILKAKAKALSLQAGSDVVLTDTSISTAANFKALLALTSQTTGNIDASSITTLKGSAADIAKLYEAGVSNLDNSTVTLTGASLNAADLLRIDDGTDIDVNAATIKTIKGSAADIADIFDAANAGTIDGLRANTKITLEGVEADAADLLAIDAGTSAKLSVAKLKTVTGEAADVAAVYQANGAKTIAGLGNEKVILEGVASVADLNLIGAANKKGQIDASDVTVISGSQSQLAALFANSVAQKITGLGSQNLELTDTGLTTAQLAAIDALTTGDISAPALETLTGSLAAISGLTNAFNAGTLLVLTDTSASAADLLALRDSVSNPIDADSILTLTGSMADILAIQAAGDISFANLSVSLSGEVAATYLLSLAADSAAAIDASGVSVLSGSLQAIADALDADATEVTGLVASDLDYKIEDSAANLLAADADALPLMNAVEVTVTGNAAGALSLAQHSALTALTTDDSWTYSIGDSTANLLDPANAAVITDAAAVTVTGNAAGTLSIAQQAALAALTTDDSWTYSISDSTANLLDPANAAVITGAAAVTVTGGAAGTLSLAQHSALTALTTDDSWAYSISDSTANLLNPTSAAVITDATAVSVIGGAAGILAITQHGALTALTTDDSWTYSINDSTANLLNPTNAAVITEAAAVTVTGNAAGALSLAQHSALTALTTDDSWAYSISDSTANLMTHGNAAPIVGAAAVTVTGGAAGTLSIAQHSALTALTTDDSWTYGISDSSANLLNPTNAAVVTAAAGVSVTGNAAGALSIAQQVALAALTTDDNWTYSISDSTSNLLNPANAAVITGAAAVTVTGNAAGALSIAQHGALTALTTDDSWTYSISDSTANLMTHGNAAPLVGAAAVTLAGGAAGTLSIAQHSALTALTTDDSWTYTISDSTTSLLNPTNAAVITGAAAVTVTGNAAGALSIAQHGALTALTTDASWTYSLSDSATNLLAADPDVLAGADGIIVTDSAGSALTVAQVAQLDALIGAGTWPYSLADSEANLWNGGLVNSYVADGIDVTVLGNASVAGLAAINAANGNGTLTYGTVAGSAAALTVDAQLNSGNGQYVSGAHPVIVTDAPSVFQLNTINTATAGIVTATIAGTAAQLAELVPGDNAYTVTIEGVATLAQLAAIDAATTLALTYGTVSGNAADLFANATLPNGPGKYVSGDHNVAVTDTPTVLQLNTINAATNGVVSATISGTAAVLAALVEGDNAYSVTVTAGPATAAQLKSINEATTVPVNATALTTITGTASDFVALVAGATALPATILLAADVTFSASETLSVAQANALDLLTGTPISAGISETDAATLATLTGTNAYSISVEGEATAAQLNSIDAATSLVVNANAVTQITGTQAEFVALLAAVPTTITLGSGFAAVVTDDDISVAQANAIAAATTGSVTATISETDAATLVTLANEVNAYSITVEGTATAEQLNIIDARTSVAVDASGVTTISGSAADLTNLLTAQTAGTISLADDFTVTVSDAASVTLLNSLNAATSGVITAGISGTATELAALTAGSNAYSIIVTTSAATLAELAAINAASTLEVNATAVTSITGSAAEFDALLQAVIDGEITLGDFAAEVTGSVTVAQLNALDAITTGSITATISGTAAELDALAESDNLYSITVTDTATLAQLVSIDAATSVALTYEGISGVNADFFVDDELTANAATYVTGEHAVTVTDGLSVAQANALDALTSGTITATINETDAATLATLTGNNAYSISVEGDATLAQLASIDAASVALTYEGITGVNANFFVDDELTANATAYVTGNHAVGVTDGLSVAQANTLDALTSGTITATISETDAATLATLIGNNAYSITVQGVVTAADLTTIDAATSVPVDATDVIAIAGSFSELVALQAAATAIPPSIQLAPTFQIAVGTLDEEGWPVFDSITVAQANALAAFCSGNVGAIISTTDAATLATLDGSDHFYTIAVTGPATAAQLNTINGKTTRPVDATGVTAISGTAAEVDAVLAAAAADPASISLDEDFKLAVSDSISVDQANAYDAATTGVVTAVISTTDAATLATLTGENNAYSITVVGTATAEQLLAIDAATVSEVNATSVTSITGTADQFEALLAAMAEEQITLDDDFTASVTGDVTVAQLNALNAVTNGIITATISGDAETLGALEVGDNAYSISVTGPATLAQLVSIDAATTLAFSYTQVSDAAAALILDASSNSGAGTYVTAAIDILVTDTPTVTQLNAINNATTGVVTATIEGTGAELGQLTPGANAYTVKVIGAATLVQLDVIDFATVLPIDFSAISDTVENLFSAGTTLNSRAALYIGDDPASAPAISVTDGLSVARANVLDAATDATVTATISATDAVTLATLTGNNAYSISVEGEATAAQLNSIDAATSLVVNANAVTQITGTLEAFTTLLAAAPAAITLASDFDAVITDASVGVADAIVLDAATMGVVTATITETDAATLVGLAPEFTIFAPVPVNAYSITVEGTATAEQLNIIDGTTSVVVDASGVTGISGTAGQLAVLLEASSEWETINLADDFTVTVSDAASVSLLNALNATTSGLVTASISGTATELATLSASENAYSITVNAGAASVAELAAINAASTLEVNATAVTSITGSAAEFDALLQAVADGEITLGNFAAEVIGSVTVDQLNALNAATEGAITAEISGTAAELAELTAGDNAYTISVTGDATLAQLASIDAATTEELAYEGITGVSADFFQSDDISPSDAAMTYLEDHAVTVTKGSLTVAQANVLDDLTGEPITATISTTDAATLATLTGTNAYSISVEGNATLAQLASIDAATSADLNYEGIIGASTDFFDEDGLSDSADVYVTGGHAITVTGILTAAQATLLTGATTGTVTATVSGTAAALAALPPGSNALAITVEDAATVAQLTAIDAATAGTLTYGTVTGTPAELYDDARLNNGDGFYVSGNHPVVVVGNPTVLELNTINLAADGLVTASISGTAAELATLVASDNAYNIIISDAVTLAQLDIIRAASANAPVFHTVIGSEASEIMDFTGIEFDLTAYGNVGNDVITGGEGNDILSGGEGADQLYGGAGEDIFSYNSAADSTLTSMDSIHDFEQGEAIYLGALNLQDGVPVSGNDDGLVSAEASANIAFHLGADIYLSYNEATNNTYVFVDANANNAMDASDMVIELVGVDATAEDFINFNVNFG